MSVLSRLLFTFSLAAVAGATLHAQQPAQKPPTIRVGVDRVNIGVIATDAQGRFVEGLSRSDFHIFDNGAEQSITDFTSVDEPADVLVLIEAGPAVYLLEDAHLRAAIGLLQGLSPADRVAIVKYSDAPEGLLDFTPDKQLAASIFDSLRFNLGFASLNLSSSLSKVLGWLGASSGKKSIVLLSTGVDTSPLPDSQATLTQLQTGDVRLFAVSLAGALRGPSKDKKKPPSSKSVPAQLDRQFAEADRFLRQLSEAAGGRAYFPVTAADFRAVYAELAQLIRHEYSLAFAPQTPDRAVHTLSVTVNPRVASPANSKLRVDHRQAYQAAAPASNEHP